MAADNVTHIAIAAVLTVGGSAWIVGDAHGLVTGQLAPRLVGMTRRRGGLTDTTATAIWVLFWGIGFLGMGATALTARNVLALVSITMIALGSVLGLLRERHARPPDLRDRWARNGADHDRCHWIAYACGSRSEEGLPC